MEKELFNIRPFLEKTYPVCELTDKMRLEIEKLYIEMLMIYYPLRAQNCLNSNHKKFFIEGIWKSIIQCRQEGITKDCLLFFENSQSENREGDYHNEEDYNNEIDIKSDLFSDIVSANVLFFLDNLKGEETYLAEDKYINFILSYL